MFFWQLLVLAILTFLCLTQATTTLHPLITANIAHTLTSIECTFPFVPETDMMEPNTIPDDSPSATVTSAQPQPAADASGCNLFDLAHVKNCKRCSADRDALHHHSREKNHAEGLDHNQQLGGDSTAYNTAHLRPIKKAVPPSAKQRNARIQEPYMTSEDRSVRTTDALTPPQLSPHPLDGSQASPVSLHNSAVAGPSTPTPALYHNTFTCDYSDSDSDDESSPAVTPTSVFTFTCNNIHTGSGSDNEASDQQNTVEPAVTPALRKLAKHRVVVGSRYVLGKRNEPAAPPKVDIYGSDKENRFSKKARLEIDRTNQLHPFAKHKPRRNSDFHIELDKSKRQPLLPLSTAGQRPPPYRPLVRKTQREIIPIQGGFVVTGNFQSGSRTDIVDEELWDELQHAQQKEWLKRGFFVVNESDQAASEFFISQQSGKPGSRSGSGVLCIKKRTCHFGFTPRFRSRQSSTTIIKVPTWSRSRSTNYSPSQLATLEQLASPARNTPKHIAEQSAPETAADWSPASDTSSSFISDVSALIPSGSGGSHCKSDTPLEEDNSTSEPSSPTGTSESRPENTREAASHTLTSDAQTTGCTALTETAETFPASAATELVSRQPKHNPYLSATLPNDWKQQRDAKAKLYEEEQKRNKLAHLPRYRQLGIRRLMQLKLEQKQDAAHKFWVAQDRSTRKRLHRKLQEMAATLPPKHLREARRPGVLVVKDADTVLPKTRPATAIIVDEAAGLVATTPGAWPEPASPVKESTDLSKSSISSAPDQHPSALLPIAEPSGTSRIVSSIIKGFGWITQSFGRTHIVATTATHEPAVPSNELTGLVFSPTSRRIQIHSASNATKTAQRILKQGDRHHPYLGSPRNGRQHDRSPEPGSPRASNESLTENMSSLYVGLPEYGPMPPPRFNNINEFFDRDEDDMLLKKSEYNLVVPDHMRTKLANQKAERAAKAELARQKELEREREARREELRHLRMPKDDLIPKISPEWQRKAEASVKTHQEFKVIGGGGTTVTSHDFQQLVPSNVWLNDNIIQASLALAAQDINSRAGITNTSQTPKCVIASSYFYNSFSDGKVRNPARGFKKEWGLTGTNFKDVDTILMPINRRSHWTMLVIRPTARTIAYVDSFHSSGHEHIEVARNFIKAMVGDAAYNANEWKTVTHKVPLQTNGWDCGVFAVTNGICLALGLDPNCYDARDMPLQRKRIAAIIMNHGFTGEFSLKTL